MMDVIRNLEEKLDKLDEEREKLENELRLKRYQLKEIEALLEGTKELQEGDAG